MLYVFRLRSYLSEKVHMMGYRMCVSSLTAIITYHNRYSKKTKKQTNISLIQTHGSITLFDRKTVLT